MTNITSRDLENAPILKSVAQTFINKFGMDMQFFGKMVNSIRIEKNYSILVD